MKPEIDMYSDERESVDRSIPDEPEYHGPDENPLYCEHSAPLLKG